jgi:hypothetical protein
VQVGEGVQLVHQPFRVHPAKRMVADIELASVIADNYDLAQQPMCLDATPQRPSVAVQIGSGVTRSALMPT